MMVSERLSPSDCIKQHDLSCTVILRQLVSYCSGTDDGCGGDFCDPEMAFLEALIFLQHSLDVYYLGG